MIILNTVEFWTGSNPLQAATTVQGQNGHLYTISPDQNGGYVILDYGKEMNGGIRILTFLTKNAKIRIIKK